MSANIRFEAQRRLAANAGFSLPEMIIAVALTAVVMTLVVTMFSAFTRTFTEQRSLSDSINVAGVGMNEVTKVIRAGTIIERGDGADLPVFVSADTESIVIHSYLAQDSAEPAPVVVELTIDADRELVEKRWRATRNSDDEWVFPSRVSATPEIDRVVARKLVPLTAAQLAAGEPPLFTYLDVDGVVISAPVASSALSTIASVQVTMTVQADMTDRADPVTLQNRVGIPNLLSSRLGLED